MVRFTPDAYAELSQRISELKDEPYVSVIWSSAQVDLVRSANGTAEWKEEFPAQWYVSVRSRSDERLEPFDNDQTMKDYSSWLNKALMSIGDLRVLFAPGASGVTNVVVSYKDGQFNVQAEDA